MNLRSAAISAASVLLIGVAMCGAIEGCGGSSSDAVASDGGSPDVVAPPRRPRPDAGDDEPFDGNVARWCMSQGQHSFCADFDGKDLLEGWEGLSSDFEPTFAAVPSDRSPPAAFSVTQAGTLPDSGIFPKSFSLAKSFKVPTPTSIRVTLDVKIESLGLDDDTFAESPITLALTHIDKASTSFALGGKLDVRSTRTETNLWGADPDGGFGPTGGGPIQSFPIGAWVHVEMELKATASGGTLTVSYDGKPAGQSTLGGADLSMLNGAYLEIGAPDGQHHTKDFVGDFDNVIVDVR